MKRYRKGAYVISKGTKITHVAVISWENRYELYINNESGAVFQAQYGHPTRQDKIKALKAFTQQEREVITRTLKLNIGE